MKIVEEKNVKVFTKRKCNNIIREDYNPLKVNCKIYKRKGLFMEYKVLKEVKKISKKYNKKEILLLKMFEKCNKMGYNIKDTKKIIKEFYLLN